jgi:hypothetical protein
MLDRYAWSFFILAEFLTQLNQDLGLPPPQAFAPPSGLGGIGGGMGGFQGLGLLAPYPRSDNLIGQNALALAASPPLGAAIAPPNTLSEDQGPRIVRILGLVDDACCQIGMVGLSKDIERAKRDAEGLFLDRKKMAFHVEHITERIVEELQEQSFLHIPPSKVRYYQNNDVFGPEIGTGFPKAREDLTNAATAFALGLNTASVFHLMRVLEHCVQRFGRKLKITAIDIKKES